MKMYCKKCDDWYRSLTDRCSISIEGVCRNCWKERMTRARGMRLFTRKVIKDMDVSNTGQPPKTVYKKVYKKPGQGVCKYCDSVTLPQLTVCFECRSKESHKKREPDSRLSTPQPLDLDKERE